VTWSRPSSEATQVLKKPVRMAYRLVNFSPVAEQGCTALDLAAAGHHVVNLVQLCSAQAQGHAQLAQIAVGAGHFDGRGGSMALFRSA